VPNGEREGDHRRISSIIDRRPRGKKNLAGNTAVLTRNQGGRKKMWGSRGGKEEVDRHTLTSRREKGKKKEGKSPSLSFELTDLGKKEKGLLPPLLLIEGGKRTTSHEGKKKKGRGIEKHSPPPTSQISGEEKGKGKKKTHLVVDR